MGYADHAKDEKRKKGRGTTNNKKRLEGLGKAGAPKSERSWGDVDPAWLLALVVLLESGGGAVRYGRSRDKAVLSIGIYLDDDSVTLWLDKDQPIEEQLRDIFEELRIRIGE
jgi:mannose/cellobiose epimerase-like protein (N-acyl-D-glucosamine 2-epimerase family)